jgi:putative FmdB family regulatory protein
MPTYDYKCGGCGFDIEDAIVKDSEAVVSCPVCEQQMEKQFPIGATFTWKKEQTHKGTKFHGGQDRRQELRNRYKKRQDWFEKQPPAVQNRLKRFARKYHVRMTPPSDL